MLGLHHPRDSGTKAEGRYPPDRAFVLEVEALRLAGGRYHAALLAEVLRDGRRSSISVRPSVSGCATPTSPKRHRRAVLALYQSRVIYRKCSSVSAHGGLASTGKAVDLKSGQEAGPPLRSISRRRVSSNVHVALKQSATEFHLRGTATN